MLDKILGNIFDAFKAKNPKLAALTIFILGVLAYAIENGLGTWIGMDELLQKILQWVIIALGFLTGSRTTSFIRPNKPQERH